MLNPEILYLMVLEIKQHAKIKYLGCILDASLSGESMVLNVSDKVQVFSFYIDKIVF